MSSNFIKYLALGDSYTIGEGVDEDQSFPVQLAYRLNLSGVKTANPLIIAKTGWTAGELLTAVRSVAIPAEFDFVTLLIGVNNQYRGLPFDEYRNDFEELLKISINLVPAASDVVVISIPDYSVTPFAVDLDVKKIALEIDAYNDYNRRTALQYGAEYVDITTGTRNAANNITFLTFDTLHPSGIAYSNWVAKIFSCLRYRASSGNIVNFD